MKIRKMSDIYVWLRQHQTVTTPSGFSYEVERFKQAADEIERLQADLADCNNDFHHLAIMFEQVRAERDHLRAICGTTDTQS